MESCFQFWILRYMRDKDNRTTESHQDDKRTGVSLLRRKAERGGTSQSAEEAAQGDFINVYKYWKEGCKEDWIFWCPVPGQKAIGTNWKTRGSAYTSGTLYCVAD